MLPSGELHIRDVGPEDGYKTYQCRTKHRLTGETRLSATKGRLVITGKFNSMAHYSYTIENYLQKIILLNQSLIYSWNEINSYQWDGRISLLGYFATIHC